MLQGDGRLLEKGLLLGDEWPLPNGRTGEEIRGGGLDRWGHVISGGEQGEADPLPLSPGEEEANPCLAFSGDGLGLVCGDGLGLVCGLGLVSGDGALHTEGEESGEGPGQLEGDREDVGDGEELLFPFGRAARTREAWDLICSGGEC